MDLPAFAIGQQNCIMAVNQSPSIPIYWDCDHWVGKVGIQNIFTRAR